MQKEGTNVFPVGQKSLCVNRENEGNMNVHVAHATY